MRLFLLISISLFIAVSPLRIVHAEQTAAENVNIDSSAGRSADSKSLYEGRCQMCHQLPEPGMLKPAQWKLILVTMQQRMQQAGVPPLTEDETEMILEYIAEQSR